MVQILEKPKLKRWVFRGCLKCSGDLFWDSGGYTCLQCGGVNLLTPIEPLPMHSLKKNGLPNKAFGAKV
jgi:hypothetical protein